MWSSAGLSPARKAWHYEKPLTLDGHFTCPAPPWQHVASWLFLYWGRVCESPMPVCVNPRCWCVWIPDASVLWVMAARSVGRGTKVPQSCGGALSECVMPPQPSAAFGSSTFCNLMMDPTGPGFSLFLMTTLYQSPTLRFSFGRITETFQSLYILI